MYRWIAQRAKGLWQAGPLGKVLAVMLVLAVAFGISGFRLGLKSMVRSSVDCGLDENVVHSRAEAYLNQIEMEYGKSRPFGPSSKRRVFEQSQFDIMYDSMPNACDSFFSVRVPIAGVVPSPLPTKRMLELLEDHEIGGRYERGMEGFFVYDEDVQTYYLAYVLPVVRLPHGDLQRAIEERRSIGEAWRKGWYEEVWLIGTGEGVAPRDPVYRPGKDPDSLLRGADAFLKDAGRSGIYPKPQESR